MSEWGGALKRAAAAALERGKSAGRRAGEAAISAADTTQHAVSAAYDKAVATADAAIGKSKKAAVAVGHAAVTTYSNTRDAVKYGAALAVLKTEKAAVLTGRAVAKVTKTSGAIGSAAKSAFDKIRQEFDPAQPVLIPRMKCLASDSAADRARRIRKRNELIEKAALSPVSAVRDRASQLKDDMAAVEMARLSANTYDQSFDNPPKRAKADPPEPWEAMSDEELREAGIKPKLLRKSKAVLYKQKEPPEFPYEPKTVLAFRGTTAEQDDILTDHDQAVGLKTDQYTAAKKLGASVAKIFPDAQVTGHSLGGGKAQAAGVNGKLHGMMFNSAGLNPNTLEMTPEELAENKGSFLQYRAEGGITKGGGDLLTGIQNSPLLQNAVYGTAKLLKGTSEVDAWARHVTGRPAWTESVGPEHQALAKELADRVLNVTTQEAAHNYELSGGKWYIPPAIGEPRGLTSKNDDGTDSSIAHQHSIPGLINGFEFRKYENINALLQATGTTSNPASYIGPVKVIYK